MLVDVCQHLLRDAIDLELNIQWKTDLFLEVIRGRKAAVFYRVLEHELQGRDEADVFENRGAEVLADAADLTRHGLYLRSKLRFIRRELVAHHHQISEIGQGLVVQVAGDAAPLAL